MRIKCKDTKEIVYNYSDYLKTGHWQNLREVAFNNCYGECFACKCEMQAGDNFVGHHRTTGAYRRIGRERMSHKFWRDDVVAVCAKCHNGSSKNHEELHEFIRVPEWARVINDTK